MKKKKLLAPLFVSALLVFSACDQTPAENTASSIVTQSQVETTTSSTTGTTAPSAVSTTESQVRDPQNFQISYRFASREEGVRLLLSNDAYYNGLTQNDLDYKLQQKNASLAEYKAFSEQQVREFTEEEKDCLSQIFSEMEETLAEKGYVLPPLDEVVLVKTTMEEEKGASGYTHGTQIYIQDTIIESAAKGSVGIRRALPSFLWHELFHCLTRNNPEFRRDMYQIIHFTVQDKAFPLPLSVLEYYISNPDVERHDSYASFRIDGQMVDCFTALVTTKHFEQPGDTFFQCSTTALVPINGSDLYYTPDQAENFNEVFGENTGYVTDPEECMADNFALALVYGPDGPDGEGYPNPEIISAILSTLSQNEGTDR